ncbi:MAG: transcriptional regulator [Candidatus Omnitrophica bacterium]|nr:transcriptional regulator [Candidatus Omnitrophota bacterium]
MQGLKELLKIFNQIKNEKDMERLFQEIFTEKERETLSNRWLLMKEIHRNIPQRDIAQKFHMSLCKITRGAKVLQEKNSLCKQLLDKNHPQKD